MLQCVMPLRGREFQPAISSVARIVPAEARRLQHRLATALGGPSPKALHAEDDHGLRICQYNCPHFGRPMTALHTLSIAEAQRLILSRELSPVTLVDAFLNRIAAVDSMIHSYILVLADEARAAARHAEAEIAAGRWRGPLHGIPFAVKDNYDVAGVRTSGASRLRLDHRADTTATAIRRLQAAGAILLGKLNTWEYGTGNGGVYFDLPFEPARNPWNLGHFTGGSSTGAGAAVAAGTAMFALGSDTGGSVRLPAAACGLQGIKPTYGLVSRAGILPNCWSLDVPGPLTWTVNDAAIVLREIAGYDEADPASAHSMPVDYVAALQGGVRGLRIGVIRTLGEDAPPIDAANIKGIESAATVLASLGAEIIDTALPVPLSQYESTNSVINWSESYSIHERDFLERGEDMGQALREKMMSGFNVRAADYLAAQRQRRNLAVATDGLVRSFDALLLPCALHTAPSYDDPESVTDFTRHKATTPFNISGHPAMSVRTGFDHAGLPTNAQIAGRYFDEATVLRVAQAYEAATTWRTRRPILEDAH
jgi:aspartyl-tRNA(Asn)/glutamyl-tRNA(Gln) amidotransferase subunit A